MTNRADRFLTKFLERAKGIEPSSQPWEGRILPLNHTRPGALATSYHPRTLLFED
jgi:hypothetical protein